MRKDLYNDIKASTNVISGDEYHELMATIAQVGSDLVKHTLGPYGSTIIIDDGLGGTYPTKDGWNCITKLNFSNPLYNTTFNLLRQVSFNAVNSVGDGTTTAMVGASEFLKQYEEIRPQLINFRQADFMEAMKAVQAELTERLLNSKDLKKVDVTGDFYEIYQIAKVATNGDEELARLIQHVYQETKNPHIHVEMDNMEGIRAEIQDGYKFECSILRLNAYANQDGGTYESDTPMMVTIFPNNVTYNRHHDIINMLARYASMNQKTILILAPYFDDLIRSQIVSVIDMAHQQGGIPNLMIGQIPGTMEIHQNIMTDLALLCNTTLFDDAKVEVIKTLKYNADHPDEKVNEDLLKQEQFKDIASGEEILVSCIGTINKLTLDKSYGFIQSYMSVVNMKDYNERITEVTEEYEYLRKKANATMNGSLNKEYMDAYMRYVKLLGKTGIIHVGGMSDVERRCLKDSVDDAVLVCRSAYQHGYIRGLNLTTLYELEQMISADGSKIDDPYATIMAFYKVTIEKLFFKTFYNVSLAVLENKYPNTVSYKVVVNDETVMGMSNKEILNYCIADRYSFDLVHDRLETMDQWTIVNSVDADVQIINAITSILTLIMTSSQVVSTVQHFDRKLTEEQKTAQEMKYLTERNATIANAITDVIDQKYGDILEGLSTMFRTQRAMAEVERDFEPTFDTDMDDEHVLYGGQCQLCGEEITVDDQTLAKLLSGEITQIECSHCGELLNVTMDPEIADAHCECDECTASDGADLHPDHFYPNTGNPEIHDRTEEDHDSAGYHCLICHSSMKDDLMTLVAQNPEAEVIRVICKSCGRVHEFYSGSGILASTAFIEKPELTEDGIETTDD